ncbi:hypothetical protein [Niveibacterium terrae]|uniref:hypothetical protein n=1 Tax=Niveibacterium terrae TaxID=3373598 RepID=UPI003A8CF21E
MRDISSSTLVLRWALCLVLLACLGSYWPGLYGNYVFDDPANILENSRLAIKSLELSALRAAFWSGDAGPLGRPFSMLTFALNHYFTGFDPFYFKLTNLVIHLINTVLVYRLARLLLPCFTAPLSEGKAEWGAVLVAALWGLHPLNLTSVLYVVQRMTSLSALFGLVALTVYVHWRSLSYPPRFRHSLCVGCLVCLALLAAVLSKESGVLFVPLLLWIEIVLLRGRRGEVPICIGRIKLIHLAWVSVLLGFFVCLAALPAYTDPAAFLRRGFTLQERLMTESRVVFYYLRLLFAPSLSELSLYHDDFIVSMGLLQPVSTLLSLLALGLVTVGCAWVVRRSPVWLFAWGWFLIGHSLESSFISLELVHEHRNYFAIIGPLLLVPALLFQIKAERLGKVIYTGVVGLCLILAFLTWQRAEIWSNLVDQAAFEAATHPRSERANYQLARVYIKLLDQGRGARYASLAREALARAEQSYRSSNGALFGLIHLAYYQKQQPSPDVVESLRRDLRERPFQNSNIGFLDAFVSCQISGRCKMRHDQAVGFLVAALENPTGDRVTRSCIDKLLARYFSEVAGDYAKSAEFARDSLAEVDDVGGHMLLGQIHRLAGEIQKAESELDLAEKMDRRRVWFQEIKGERKKLAQASSEKTALQKAVPEKEVTGD